MFIIPAQNAKNMADVHFVPLKATKNNLNA